MVSQENVVPTLNRMLPLLLLLVLGTIWGAVTSISKFIAINGVPPVGSVVWQAGGAAVVLLIVARLRGGSIKLNRRAIVYYVVVGLIGYAIPNANMIFVTREIPAGLMAVVITMGPVFTYLMVLGVGIERLNGLRLLGIACGFAGACVLVLPKGSLPSPDMLPFVLIAFATPFLYSIGNTWAEKHRPTDMDSVALASGMLFAATIGMTLAAVATGNFHPIWAEAKPVNFVLAGYSMLSVVAFLIFFEIIRLAGAVFLSQVAYVVTLTGLGWGAIFYSERPSAWVWLAVALVFVGVTLVNLGKGGRKAPQAK